LQDGTIHGAGLDVFEFGDYPLPDFLDLANVDPPIVLRHSG